MCGRTKEDCAVAETPTNELRSGQRQKQQLYSPATSASTHSLSSSFVTATPALRTRRSLRLSLRNIPIMDYQRILKLSPIPNIILLLLSLVSLMLTTHYWILTDYIMGRLILRPSTFPEKNRYPTDKVVVDFTESSTNATIVAGCLCLVAAINAIIGAGELRRHELDLEYHKVCNC